MFGVIIFIHELGHFLCAKAFHVAIEEFAIGMGPKLFSRVGKDGVRYSLRLIPMGGYVSMVGEDEESDNPGALCRKPVWQRMIIVAAGAVMNLLLGFVLMGFAVGFSPEIYSTTISGFNVVDNAGNPVQTEEILGLRVGDTIKKIGSRSIHVRSDFIYEVMFLKDTPVDITLDIRGNTVTTSVNGRQIHTTQVESGQTEGPIGMRAALNESFLLDRIAVLQNGETVFADDFSTVDKEKWTFPSTPKLSPSITGSKVIEEIQPQVLSEKMTVDKTQPYAENGELVMPENCGNFFTKQTFSGDYTIEWAC